MVELHRVRPTLMGAFGILFCNNFKRVFLFFFFIMVNGRKTHSCVEEKITKASKIIAKYNSKRSHKSWPNSLKRREVLPMSAMNFAVPR